VFSEPPVYERIQLLISAFGDVGGGPSRSGVSASDNLPAAVLPEEARFTGLAIRHVLVPLDGSPLAESALPSMIAVARAFSAHVTLMHVLESRQGVDSLMALDALEWEIRRAESQAYLTSIQERLRESGVSAEVRVVQGRAAEQILEFANSAKVDLIVLSSHGESGRKEWHLSSTTEKVIVGARTSVLMVPAGGETPKLDRQIRKLLVPLDCSQRAECILSPAVELARVHGADLILAHVVREPELPRRVAPSTDDLRLAEQLTQRNRAEATRYLRDVARRLTPLWSQVRVRIRVGPERVRALQELAVDEGADLVVLSAHGSTGDASKAYGGLSARLLHETQHPVIILQDFADTMREQGGPRH
jgi:nucleotide-binding universal stress UspA family protein